MWNWREFSLSIVWDVDEDHSSLNWHLSKCMIIIDHIAIAFSMEEDVMIYIQSMLLH